MAAHGYFERHPATGDYAYHSSSKAATAFLFKLISRLQDSATVPMIDIMAHAEWLAK